MSAMPKLPELSGPAKQRLVMGVLAVALFGVAVWLYQHQRAADQARLAAREKKLRELYQTPIDVVVAAKDLPEETALEPSMLAFAKVPERFAQPYAVKAPERVIGLVTIAPIAAGEQVLTNKLRRPEEFPESLTLSSVVPKGKRAVTITVNTLSGVGGFVRPGDLVDVVWTLGVPSGNKKEPDLITVTLFQDVPVMAVERQMVGQPPLAPAGGPEGEKADKGGATRSVAGGEGGEYTVTLALSPQEISFLLFARDQGRIQLSLRPQEEEGSKAALVPVNMTTMLGAALGTEALQAAQPPPRRQVEVYKGLTRDIVVLSEGGAATSEPQP